MKDFVLLAVVGTSRAGKSTLVGNLLNILNLNPKPVVFLADRYTRKNCYKNVTYGRDKTMEKGKMIEEWCNRNYGRWIVIEDITVKLNSKLKETLKCLLTRRRVNIILITQNMIGMRDIIKEVRFFVFFNTANLTNLNVICRGNEKYVAQRIHQLGEYEYIIIDAQKQIMTKPLVGVTQELLDVIKKGEIQGESFKPKDEERDKIDRKESRLRMKKICHLLLLNQDLTYKWIAERLEVTENYIGLIVYRMRNKGFLPAKPKGKWTKEDIETCLKKLYSEWK